MTTLADETTPRETSSAAEAALVRGLYASPMSGSEIEARSFSIIDSEASRSGIAPDQWQIIRRMIHTCADLEIASSVRFSPTAISSGIAALRNGSLIYVDSNMIRAGLSLARLQSANSAYEPNRVLCHVADEDIASHARESGLPRSLFAVRKASHALDGGVAVFGNAPVALLELNRMIKEEGIRPALVIAMPVGFVHVIESKEEFMKLGIPFIATSGRRGGSPLAVSVLHALCNLERDESLVREEGRNE